MNIDHPEKNETIMNHTPLSCRSELHIGLDVDGVLADYMGGIAAVGRSMGLLMDGADRGPTQYGLVEPGWFPDEQAASEAMRTLRDVHGLDTLDLLDADAPAAVRRLRDAGHVVSIVTARAASTRWSKGFVDHSPRERTVEWLARHGFETDAVRFERSKALVGCDVYLDDAPHNIAELRDAGLHAVAYDATYNRHVDGLRVRTVSEFAEMVLSGRFDRLAPSFRSVAVTELP